MRAGTPVRRGLPDGGRLSFFGQTCDRGLVVIDEQNVLIEEERGVGIPKLRVRYGGA